jgi:hypothetical protein
MHSKNTLQGMVHYCIDYVPEVCHDNTEFWWIFGYLNDSENEGGHILLHQESRICVGKYSHRGDNNLKIIHNRNFTIFEKHTENNQKRNHFLTVLVI